MAQTNGLDRCNDCGSVRAAWSVKDGECAVCREVSLV